MGICSPWYVRGLKRQASLVTKYQINVKVLNDDCLNAKEG